MRRSRHASVLLTVVSMLLWAAAGRAQSPSPITVDTLRLAFYDYDPTLPLNPELKPLEDKDPGEAALRTRYRLAYDSAHDQRVPAIVAIPKRFVPPFPAVVILAGSGGHKDTDYVRVTSDMMCTMGYATISIDAQYHGERSRPGRTGDFHFINTPTNRDAWVQTVIDLRRAVDYMQSRPDVDPKRIGYMGFSQGSMVGGTFLGVEPRITMACLAVGGGGLVEWAKTLNLFKPEYEREVEVNAAIVDAIHFIGRFAGKPLLFLAAKKDEMIPRAATDALYGAAGEGKQIIWYDTGHVMSGLAVLKVVSDVKPFFARNLGPVKAGP